MSSPSSAQLSRFAQAQNEVLSRQRDRAQFQDAMVMMKEQEEASQATMRGYRESMADLQSRLGPAKDEVTFPIEPRSNRTDDSEPIPFYLCLTSDLSLSRSPRRRLFDSIFNEDSILFAQPVFASIGLAQLVPCRCTSCAAPANSQCEGLPMVHQTGRRLMDVPQARQAVDLVVSLSK